MVELKGSLNGIGLPAIVQLIGELRHSGSLELSKDTTHGVLDFDDGRLVAADFAEATGFQALARLSLELSDGEFTFIEGVPLHERTLDLGTKDVQAYLRRVGNGEDFAEAVEPPPVPRPEPVMRGVCPLLGFADDRARHYSRPTALHRCFATGAPSLVSGHEQRELCLGDQYPTCMRYLNASTASPVAIASGVESHATAPTATVELPASGPALHAETPPVAAPAPADVTLFTADLTPPTEPPPAPSQTSPPRPVPGGVAAHMANANSMHLPGSASNNNADVPTWIGHIRSESGGSSDADRSARAVGPRIRRALLLVGTGVVVGLILVVGVVLVSMPAFNSGLSAQKPSVAGTQAFGPVATPTRASATATTSDVARAKPTAAPGVAASRPSTPTAGPSQSGATGAQPQGATSATRASVSQSATSSAAAGDPLIDVRFAAGPSKGWLDNPAVAAWSDGAYRLQARQPARFVAIGAPVNQSLSDVVVSGTFRKTGGPPGGGYGLVVRDQGPDPRDGVNQTMNAFVLEAGDLGEFGIWRRDGDHWVDLVAWTRSAAVRMGGSPNDLTVRAIGNRLTFTINGTQVASVEDGAPMAGGAGVFIGGDYNEVALDRFSVQAAD